MKRPAASEAPKKAQKKAPKLRPKAEIEADGAKAVIKPPLVPPNKRVLVNRPDVRKRSLGEHLEAEKVWYLAGAYDDNGVPLRDANLSDRVAKEYFNRFLLLVAMVDAEEGEQDACWQYLLPIRHVSKWMLSFSSRPKNKAGDKYAASYVGSLRQAVHSMASCFVKPEIDWPEWLKWEDDLKRITAVKSLFENHNRCIVFQIALEKPKN